MCVIYNFIGVGRNVYEHLRTLWLWSTGPRWTFRVLEKCCDVVLWVYCISHCLNQIVTFSTIPASIWLLLLNEKERFLIKVDRFIKCLWKPPYLYSTHVNHSFERETKFAKSTEHKGTEFRCTESHTQHVCRGGEIIYRCPRTGG